MSDFDFVNFSFTVAVTIIIAHNNEGRSKSTEKGHL